jgi:NAD(P)H-quinone oxidoreductase subunit 4
MQMYDAKTVAINAKVRQSYTIISQSNPSIYAYGFLNHQVARTEFTPVLGTLK